MPRTVIPDQPQRAIEPIEAARGRESLAIYGVLTRGLAPAPHHKGIIDAVTPEEWNKGAAVICPPQSGKSTWISEVAPNFLIGRRPDHLILHIHSNDEKANMYLTTLQQTWEHNEAHKLIFPDVVPDYERGWSSRGLYFKWRDHTGKWPIIDTDGWARQSAKDPQYVSIGFMGGAIGRRADTIILDDPFDPKDIDSPTFRMQFEKRFRTVVETRLKPGGRIIWVSNRWHQDDMAPKLEAWGYKFVVFKAIQDVLDDTGNKVGEKSYWPQMWPLKKLQEIRENWEGSDFSCLYQGEPVDEATALFQEAWWQECDVDEEKREIRITHKDGRLEIVPFSLCKFGQACDPAASEKDSADYFVLGTAAFHNGRFFIVDWLRERLTVPRQPALAHDAYDHWPQSAGMGMEANAMGLGIVQLFIQEGIPVVKLARHADKIERWKRASNYMMNGCIYFRRGAKWLKDLKSELLAVPRARHDDQADVLADLTELLGQRKPAMTTQQKLAAIASDRAQFWRAGAW